MVAIFEQAHGNKEHISFAQKFRLNDYTDLSSGARVQNYGLSLHLLPYLVYASSEGSGQHLHGPLLLHNTISIKLSHGRKFSGLLLNSGF